MSRIPPVPTTRISGLLTRQRLTQQYQTDQLDLFRLQEQISTGLRITLPSQDAPAALRAISFQRLLARKEQFASNIDSGQLFLRSIDSALAGDGGVTAKLNEIKSNTLGAVETVATDGDRQSVINLINNDLKALVALANRQSNGRYLFSGSQTDVQPFSFEGDNVIYHGDDREIRNYSDIGVLFSTSISGQEVFGGISAAVEGQVDLNPQVHADTLLSSLRGGRGINAKGSLQIANNTTNEISIVDLSRATTIGDVAKLIEDNPPEGSHVNVTVTGNGIEIALSSGSLTISEVGTGSTARELGILGSGGPSTIVSEDLDPQLLKTTRLENLLGTKARAVLTSGAGDDNNDIFIEASANGLDLNDVTITIVDGGDIGNAVGVVYDDSDPFNKTLTISVDDDGETTANQVIEAINAEGTFRAELDRGDTQDPSEAGTGFVEFSATTTTSDGSGETLDQSSGIRVVNGGQTFEFKFDQDETLEDLLNRLNRSEAGLHAEINEAGTGINIRSRLSGNDFQIGEIDGGTTATQLGIRTFTEDTRLSDFNFGVGVPTKDAADQNITKSDLKFTTSDGSSFDVNIGAVANIGDVINDINNDVDNLGFVTAQLNSEGNGIDLIDNTVGTEKLFVAESGAEIAITGGVDLTIPTPDFNITAKDGVSFAVNLSGAKSVGDVLDLINNATGNAGRVTARLAESGNGVELFDNTGSAAGDLTVTKVSSSRAAEFLGLLDEDQTTKTSPTDTLTGKDNYALETESVFTSLIRLRDALANDDIPEISRAVAKIDEDFQRVIFAQADVGARLQSLDLTEFNLQDEEIQIRSALSEEIDVDLVEAISQMTARQISLEASLRATANILQLSLLNFI